MGISLVHTKYPGVDLPGKLYSSHIWCYEQGLCYMRTSFETPFQTLHPLQGPSS